MTLSTSAQFAQAAYANLTAGMSANSLSSALQLPEAAFTATQAQQFAAQHSVVLQYNDDASPSVGNDTGLSLTVFKGIATNQLTLAIRGTLGTKDHITANQFIAIPAQGAGYPQIAALYNWWLRATALPGTLVPQYTWPMPNGISLQRKADASATGEMRNVLAADPDQSLQVTGHSLGGHLAMAFGAMFDAATSSVTSFNAPGFQDNPANRAFFATLGGTLPGPNSSVNAKTTNVIADGVRQADVSASPIAGLWSRPGLAVDVPIENQWLAGEPVAPGSFNHSQMVLTDALAVYALFDKLSPGLSTGGFDGVLEAASNREFASLEALIGAARSMLGLGSAALPAGNDRREDLYLAIKSLTDSSVYAALADKLDISPASASLASTARNDFASLLALQALSPLVLRAKSDYNSLVETALANANNTSYIAWLADKALSTADRNAGGATYSDQWIADRASMLDWVATRNAKDLEGVINEATSGRAIPVPLNFQDFSSGTQLQLRAADNNNQRAQIIFGSASNEPINGFARDDRLYGGAGNDELSGQGGNDYLEGNADNDTLNGGEGIDTLVGGIGADWLIGGAGTDRLQGGLDADYYSFETGWGIDTIEDIDGLGSIAAAGVGPIDGAGAVKLVDGVWQSADKQVTYTLDDASSTLVITFRGRNDSIIVPNWTPQKNLGISLAAARSTPTTTTTRLGDYKKLVVDGVYQGVLPRPLDYIPDGYEANAQDVISGDTGNDFIAGLGGNDGLSGSSGDDWVDGGSGNDLLLGGSGSDLVVGGDGSDWIYGQGAYFTNRVLSVNETPIAGVTSLEAARGFSWVVTADAVDNVGVVTGNFWVSGAEVLFYAPDGENVLDGGAVATTCSAQTQAT